MRGVSGRFSRLSPHALPVQRARHSPPPSNRRVAYFTAEVALEQSLPTYSGGLGVLAGDHIKTAADMMLPMVGVTLLYRGGYFTQRLGKNGEQFEDPVIWRPEDHLRRLADVVNVKFHDRSIKVGAWEKPVVGHSKYEVPMLFLDTDVEGNSDWDRSITRNLYGGDHWYRLAQEIVLGRGGFRMLEQLGHTQISTYHMNEGHSCLLTLDLLRRLPDWPQDRRLTPELLDRVRQQCVFTTHTPIPAGHRVYDHATLAKVLGEETAGALYELIGTPTDQNFNTSKLAAACSHFVNGVSRKHGEVTRALLPGYDIEFVTNGVHVPTWTAPSIQALFDAKISNWRANTSALRQAESSITLHELRDAHAAAKLQMMAEVQRLTGVELKPDYFTIGFARRATAYKRHDLLFHDLDALVELSKRVGPLQVVYAGKAHPHDGKGKEKIQAVLAAAEEIRKRSEGKIQVVYLPNYEMDLGRLLTSGVDLWLNNPERFEEASGTSGMKAAMNGVPSLSVLDGWWIEGCFEGVTGWAIGNIDDKNNVAADAKALYGKLELPMTLYYKDPDAFTTVGRRAIAINGPMFSMQRMLNEYRQRAYRLGI